MSMKNKTGIELIAKERLRQIKNEGWTAEHDRLHEHGELAKAAACYAVQHTDARVIDHIMNLEPILTGEYAWPWDDKWWKPSDAVTNLIKAGALIAAEIDRLQFINQNEKP